MKGFTEMTEQEILALTEEDVQKLIKLRMMEEGIKIMDKPEVPELFEIEPADLKVFTIPFFEGYAFTDMEEANAVAEALRNAKPFAKLNTIGTNSEATTNISSRNNAKPFAKLNTIGTNSEATTNISSRKINTITLSSQTLRLTVALYIQVNYTKRFQTLPHRTRL